MAAYQVRWFRCKSVGWCDLFRINLEHPSIQDVEAVYICWTGSVADVSRKYLIVGQGMIKDEISKLRNETGIKAFDHQGVFVTWAEVPHYRLNSIEVFCYNKLEPIFPNDELPEAKGREVNLPFDEKDDKLKDGLFR